MAVKDLEFYTRRARQERELAERALDATARHAHEKLASEYESRARMEGMALRIANDL
ncbi:hypothetical protein [Sphingomonas tagetis]|uniref:hypothetical protein n=1 Tax=Sphingomonas tagetis TaxID=2949092 RepID=UPI0020B65063|nr:hypothetical protein [Sphingomonas tagetis]